MRNRSNGQTHTQVCVKQSNATISRSKCAESSLVNNDDNNDNNRNESQEVTHTGPPFSPIQRRFVVVVVGRVGRQCSDSRLFDVIVNKNSQHRVSRLASTSARSRRSSGVASRPCGNNCHFCNSPKLARQKGMSLLVVDDTTRALRASCAAPSLVRRATAERPEA